MKVLRIVVSSALVAIACGIVMLLVVGYFELARRIFGLENAFWAIWSPWAIWFLWWVGKGITDGGTRWPWAKETKR